MENCFHITNSKHKIEMSEQLLSVNFLTNNSVCLNLTSCIEKYYKIAEIAKKIISIEASDEKLYNHKVRDMALKFAHAIDSNDVETLKMLKKTYSMTPQYSIVQKFLDNQCKKVWDAIDNKNKKLNVPKECFKVLGITNEPTLDYLLADSLNFFEKSNKDITSKIINSILNNKNLSYTPDDIQKYLKQKVKNNGIKLGQKTLKYFITRHKYCSKQLAELGADKRTISKIYCWELFLNDLKYAFS